MERNRLAGWVLPLLLLGMSSGVAAVEVLPEPNKQAAMQLTQQVQQTQQQPNLQHLTSMVGQRPAESVAKIELTTADQQQLNRDNEKAPSGTPFQVGVVKALTINVDLKPLDVAAMTDQTYSFQGGVVRKLSGRLTWAMRMDTVNAAGMRIRFDNVNLPDDAAIYIYNDAGDVRGPYRAKGKSFWTHTMTGEQIYIQVEQPDQASSDASFRVGAIMLLDASSKAFCPNNASCVEDASCHDTNDWSEIDKVRKAVARINYIKGDGSYLCTGGLLADTDTATSIPYFLTANHCINTLEVATTVETWFDYHTTSCNSECPTGPGPSSTLGATLVQRSAVDDHSLLLLDEPPPADAWFLGWSDAPIANSNGTILYRLSHPRGSPQAYSAHQIDASKKACFCLPHGKFIYSLDTIGATEGGSSGSPVVQANGQVVGQLYGACGSNADNVCDSISNSTVDGAFANYYSRVAKWLNPNPKQLPLIVSKVGTGHGRVMSSLADVSDTPLPPQDSLEVKPMLLGGVKAESSLWPWQAALKISTWRVNGEWTCGGSVIDSKWVLTAAHCIVDDMMNNKIDDPYHANVTVAPANIQIRVGSERFEFGGQTVGVKRIVKHPDFNPVNLDHDIALLELKEPVFVQPIRPVTLQREAFLACSCTSGIVTGWTATDVCGNLATILSRADTTLVDPKQCRDVYGSNIVTSNTICTQSDEEEDAPCQQDTGGPLVVDNGRGGYVQAGIVIGGGGCEAPDRPTIHTRLAKYVEWMESMTGLDLSSNVDSSIIDCGNTCSGDYANGTIVTLTAIASPGSTFNGWNGACSGTESTCKVAMSQASNVRATFTSDQIDDQSCIASAP